ncbi:UDP-GlcNAc:betaGal beta-1,3-N-acetylglucosaminyltransferase 7 [Larimichthys crocea]|uniref:Hexosyltransferase n=1 Tax=Larimichthys crocea TaxID=215358 RepID=A0A6G0IP44_LARCR|nr:UDP-GlcNAc:betaGal beta-1,3-N-acetylglucosaminyltransferase 7 [Larimichthys crocea]
MDNLFRRKRVGLLKPLLSLSLVFASFLMIHKLKVAEKDGVGVKHMRDTSWCGSECFSFKKGVVKNSLVNSDTPAIGNDLDAQRVSNRTPALWDAQVINCSEDASVKNQDWFRRLDPRFHQFVLHRHCRYFPMILNHPEKCTDGEVHLLMVVKSVIEQHDRREAVRKTWGKEHTLGGKKIKTLFLLGSPTTGKDTKNLQKLIEYEDRIYGDILQWDFMDTFFNLTLKEVNFLKWFNIYLLRCAVHIQRRRRCVREHAQPAGAHRLQGGGAQGSRLVYWGHHLQGDPYPKPAEQILHTQRAVR